MEVNNELNIAWDFINNTDRNVFLTGKAGTGKTTFLHRLKKDSLKRMVVVAPTGVAAINAKGVTIHSFFQMPFGPILPHAELGRDSGFNRKFNKTKINIIKSLDLLVIDEISMVRADLLDGIDKTLRRYKNKNKVFGGVQLLMIGDLQQLAPVIKEQEWQLLKPYYKNVFFFSSQAYQNCHAITIELKHIYRQDNPVFINILNEIRNNVLTQYSADELNKCYQPNFVPDEKEGYVSLTTHNNKAEQTNNFELKKIKTKAYCYKAVIEGRFPEYAYPNDAVLTLKVGAQVMFVKNDSSSEKRYFNGKIGKVILLSEDEVIINCPEDDFNIITTPETWENINYTVDADTKEITENKVGSYTQMPLRLAWSITIHKSQGLTFEKAIIDAQGAFAHGQTYVALSRCKSLEGLVLKNKINASQIISDANILSFVQHAENNQPDKNELLLSKIEFQLDLISELFDFHEFLYPINRALDIFYKNRNSVEGELDTNLNTMKAEVANLLKIGNSFKLQLKTLLEPNTIPEISEVIQKRFVKAIGYFNERTKRVIVVCSKALLFTTDNKVVEKDLSKHVVTIETLLATKLLLFEGLNKGFNVETYLALRAKAIFLSKEKAKQPRRMNVTVTNTNHLELFELLRNLRSNLAETNDIMHYQVFTQKALYEMCEVLPTNTKALLQVNGMGKVRVKKYGEEILKIIRTYCESYNICISREVTVFNEDKPKKQKGDTKKASLKLFKLGKTIKEIADIRLLNSNTIFGHLAHFVPLGEVKITDLMPESHYKELKQLIPKYTFENLSDLKHQLDDKYNYGELRLVLNELNN